MADVLSAYNALSEIYRKSLDLIGDVMDELESLKVEIKESEEELDMETRIQDLLQKIDKDLKEQKQMNDTLLTNILKSLNS